MDKHREELLRVRAEANRALDEARRARQEATRARNEANCALDNTIRYFEERNYDLKVADRALLEYDAQQAQKADTPAESREPTAAGDREAAVKIFAHIAGFEPRIESNGTYGGCEDVINEVAAAFQAARAPLEARIAPLEAAARTAKTTLLFALSAAEKIQDSVACICIKKTIGQLDAAILAPPPAEGEK
jgi:hypothetical protein